MHFYIYNDHITGVIFYFILHWSSAVSRMPHFKNDADQNKLKEKQGGCGERFRS